MKWIVTGAAGFIGCNAVAAITGRGDSVIGIDNLSRPGADQNLAWLRDQPRFEFVRADICNAAALDEVFQNRADVGAVLHLAGQVAVTTSIRDPRHDFETNALGTLNICEAVRRHAPDALLLNASTNKVYGSGADELVLDGGRWTDPSAPQGTDESAPLAFHSPYACSKGAADQYVLDFARTYGMRTVSLRQSCIYGPRQFGIEDQGWLAWFSVAALAGAPITIFGDGRQVRDVLHVDDLVDLYVRCTEIPDRVAGRAVNIGGGPANTLSLLELVSFLETRVAHPLELLFGEPRLGDQRTYISDVSLARDLLDWEPTIGTEQGLEALLNWLRENFDQVAAVLGSERLGA